MTESKADDFELEAPIANEGAGGAELRLLEVRFRAGDDPDHDDHARKPDDSAAGNYLIWAKGYANGTSDFDVTCELVAGTDSDTTKVHAFHISQSVVAIVAHQSATTGTADFQCAAVDANTETMTSIKIRPSKPAASPPASAQPKKERVSPHPCDALLSSHSRQKTTRGSERCTGKAS